MRRSSQNRKKREAGFILPGLSVREKKILDVLAKEGSLNISEIALQSGLHRPAVYACLKALDEKKLIRILVEKKRKTYALRGKVALKAWTHSWQKAALQTIPFFEAEKEGGREMKILRGKGLRTLWEQILQDVPKGGVFYRYDAYPRTVSPERYFPNHFYERMERKGIDRFVMTNVALRTSAYKKRVACASHVFPAAIDTFEQGVTQFVFADTIAFVDFTQEIAFVLKNKALAEFQRQLFRAMYHYTQSEAVKKV